MPDPKRWGTNQTVKELVELYPRLLRAPGAEALTLEEHRAILDAIAVHDENRAVKALAGHLLRSDPRYGASAHPSVPTR